MNNNFYKKITINGKDCANVDFKSLIERASIEKLVIPEGTTRIGRNFCYYYVMSAWEDNFSGKYKVPTIHEVVLPSSLKTIDSSAFETSGLQVINLPQGLEQISDYVFNDCPIQYLTIPASVKKVGSYIFGSYSSYNRLVRCEATSKPANWDSNWIDSSTVRVIWNCNNTDMADDGNYYIVENNVIYKLEPSHASAWGLAADAETITIADTITYKGNTWQVTEISDYFAGQGYESRHEDIKHLIVGKNVEYIGENAFTSCCGLKSVTGLDFVETIGSYAFYYCENLEYVDLGNVITQIGDSAFSGCTKLKTVKLPKSFTNFTNSIIDSSIKIDLYYGGTLEDWCQIDFSAQYSHPKGNLYINNELVTSLVLSETITGLKQYAFYGCDSLVSLETSNTLSTIGKGAFQGCTHLETVKLGASINTLGDAAFKDCNCLSQIEVVAENNAYSTVNNVLYNKSQTVVVLAPPAKNYANFALPNTITNIGAYAFSNCTQLTSLTLPSTVTTIGNSAFEKTSLTAITIPNTVTSLGTSVFSNCTSLHQAILPNNTSLTTIPSSLFSSCRSLCSITIPKNITSIGGSAFSDCYALVEVYNLSSVSITAGTSSYSNGYIGEHAKVVHKSSTAASIITKIDDFVFCTFNNVNYLIAYLGTATELTLLSSFNGLDYAINKKAFYYNKKLTKVICPDAVTDIGNAAFEYCDNLSVVVLGNKVKTIENYAFYKSSGVSLTLYITALTPPTLASTSVFYYNGANLKAIYIPTIAAVNSYKNATNWATYSNKILQGEYVA